MDQLLLDIWNVIGNLGDIRSQTEEIGRADLSECCKSAERSLVAALRQLSSDNVVWLPVPRLLRGGD
jgi:hypothetical protein